MNEPYGSEPYESEPYEQEYPPAPRRRMSGWLIALIVILVLVILCCLCVLVAYLVSAPRVGNVFSTIIETIQVVTPGP
jgi:hypothetical protein